MSFSVKNMMFAPESFLNFSLTQLFNLFSGQWQVCWTIIRRIFSSGAFGVHATARYLVFLIWVYENNGHFAYFNPNISIISYLYFLHIPIDTYLWLDTLLWVICSLSLNTQVYPHYRCSQFWEVNPNFGRPILGTPSQIWNQRTVALAFFKQ